jgi:DNA-cytosine methyltransferase
MTLKVLDLFAGAGGFTIAGELAGGYETVAFCEIDKHARKVLAKNWPDVPIFEDVTKLHASDIDGTIDVITGGFPCQDLSSAGRGAGLGEGTRSGLFREMLRLACEVRERQGGLPYIIFENVARLLSGPTEAPGEWFGEFLWALAEVGYDAEWFCITAASIGAPHMRERVCVVAYANENAWEQLLSVSVHNEATRQFDERCGSFPLRDRMGRERGKVVEGWRITEPAFCMPSYGISSKTSGLSAGIMGNAIVPQVFAIPMRSLREYHEAAT